MTLRRMFVVLLLVVSCAGSDAAQVTQAPPAGQVIRAREGDVILVENGERVKVVRRQQANVRAIFNAAQRWLVVLADYPAANGGTPDGFVDRTFTFQRVAGDWPLGERWDGSAVVDEYEFVGRVGSQGLGLATPAGLIQLVSTMGGASFRDQTAVATLSYAGFSGGGGSRQSFDEVEQREMQEANENAAGRASSGAGRSGISMGVSLEAQTASSTSAQPVRVGGNVAQPRKVKDVSPVYPETARAAGVSGMVILEIVIGTDGRVATARVLRSIPLLDQAAVEAAKQWVYEPTYLNGVPVPVIMTATVTFQ